MNTEAVKQDGTPTKPTPKPTCGRCGSAVEPNDGFVVYLESGGREAGSKNRITAHGVCIADEVADGRIVRVSDFAVEATA